MSVEFYYSPYCAACGTPPEENSAHKEVEWIDVTTRLESAVRLRITRLPALVADGKLIAQGPRALERLRILMEKGELA